VTEPTPSAPASAGIDGFDALDRADRVFFQMAIDIGRADGVIGDDAIYGTMRVPIPALNSVVRTRFTAENADRRIEEVVAWFGARQMPIGWWVSERETPHDLGRRLERHGFVADGEHVPGMIASLDHLPDEVPPAGTFIERARDAVTFKAACDVMYEGFAAPPILGEAFEAFAALGFGDEVPLRVFVARLDGAPVATATGVVGDDALAIYNVTTLPAARRRGIGQAVMLAAMRDGAALGCQSAVLQSSEAGHGVYEALGFRDFGTYRLFVHPADG
jgi:ribosomal protein S18 acetylase RimI-like enzyme